MNSSLIFYSKRKLIKDVIFILPLNLGIRGHDISASTPTDLGKRAANFGLTNTQLAPCKSFPTLAPSLESVSLGTGAAISTALTNQGIFISVLGCYVNISSEDKTIRTTAITNFKRHIRASHAFKANMIGTETGSMKDGYCKENFTEEAYSIACHSIAEMVAYAEDFGAIVGIEPGLNHPIYSIERLHKLVQDIRSEHLRLILDFSNLLTPDTLNAQKEIMENAFEKLDGHIEHFHIKDCIVQQDKLAPVAVGNGNIDFTPILTYIKNYYPSMSMTFEETKEKDVATAVEYLTNLYNTI